MKKCPYCAEQIQDEAVLCLYCGSSLVGTIADTSQPTVTDSKDVSQQKDSSQPEKQRHGCLTIWLTFGIIFASISLIAYGLNIFSIPSQQNVLINLTPLYIGLNGFNILCYIELFRWKKWGFWGLCAAFAASSIITLATGGNIFIVIIGTLISIAILYGVLQIGGERKGWPQLE